MSGSRIALLLGGAGFEFLGIIILAAPDLLPYRDPILRWLDRTTALLDRRIRGVRPLPTVASADSGAIGLRGERPALIKSVGARATLEQKVDFLLGRDLEAQSHVNALRDRVEDLDQESAQRLQQARDEVEKLFREELTRMSRAYRLLKICGAGALLVGLSCTTFANFIN
jgi:hypothetical protein